MLRYLISVSQLLSIAHLLTFNYNELLHENMSESNSSPAAGANDQTDIGSDMQAISQAEGASIFEVTNA